jgi:hypothetical protein
MDITSLVRDDVRATFLADCATDPEGGIAILMGAIDEHLAATDSDKLADTLCGPVMGAMGALMIASLAARFTAGPEGNEWDGDPMELFVKGQIAAQTVEHAANDHGDSLALAIRYGEDGTNADPTLQDSLDAAIAWVTDALWSFADLDADLILIDAWGEDSGPDAA